MRTCTTKPRAVKRGLVRCDGGMGSCTRPRTRRRVAASELVAVAVVNSSKRLVSSLLRKHTLGGDLQRRLLPHLRVRVQGVSEHSGHPGDGHGQIPHRDQLVAK